MDEQRIKQTEKNFKNYLEQGLIKRLSFQEIIYQTYINNFQESLEVANELYKNKTSSLWVVVSSYYSIPNFS